MSNIRHTKEEWDAIYEEERRLKEEKLLTREEYEALTRRVYERTEASSRES